MSNVNWRIIRYSGYSLPDSVLYHEANEVSDEFYLSTDEPAKDILDSIGTDGMGNFLFGFASYRKGSVQFTQVVFTNGPDTLIAFYPICTSSPGTGGITSSLGRDTICLDEMATYSITGLMPSQIQSAQWSIIPNGTGSALPFTGSGSVLFNPPSGSGTSFTVLWGKAGTYTVNVQGRTAKNCIINSTKTVFVRETDYDITGFAFACVNDTLMYQMVDSFPLSVFNTVTWTLDPAGKFVGDSLNVKSIKVRWTSMGTHKVYVEAMSSAGATCTVRDTFEVKVDSLLGAQITGPAVLCVGSTRGYKAKINNLQTINWTSKKGTIIGSAITDSLTVMFNQAGLDTLYVTGTTTMGCTVQDSFYVDIKDSQIALSGTMAICVGDTVGYRAMYTDSSIANFVNIQWSVVPMDSANTTKVDTAMSPNDSLTVIWGKVGFYNIIVNGVTDLGCNLRDTFLVSVQDTGFVILGETLACVQDTSIFRLVQSQDSTDVVSGVFANQITWKVVRQIGNNIQVPELVTDTDGNDTLKHKFTTGTFRDITYYLVIAVGQSDNGCPIADTLRVEVIGKQDLTLYGPDDICSGADALFRFDLPKALLGSKPIWTAYQKGSGAPVAPSSITSPNDTAAMISFPNVADTFIVQVQGNVKGQCNFTLTKQVIMKDTIGFVIDGIRRVSPATDTLCLQRDSVWFSLNVDTSNVNLNNIQWTIQKQGDLFTTALPKTGLGTKLATYFKFQTAGKYTMRVTGALNFGGCDIDETLIITIKDTAYTILGDDQICLGDTISYNIVQAWDGKRIDTLWDKGKITWKVLNVNGMVQDTSKYKIISAKGSIGDSLRIVWKAGGKFRLSVMDTTLCLCPVMTSVDVLVRNNDYVLAGPANVCRGDIGDYAILNFDSSLIKDLIPDSSHWTVKRLSAGNIIRVTKDSIKLRWDVPGSYVNAMDTIYFRGRTDDGCVVRDTLFVKIRSKDFVIVGRAQVCKDDPVKLTLRNASNNSWVNDHAWLKWTITPGGTLVGDTMLTKIALDTLGGMSTSWSKLGTYVIRAFGKTKDSCAIEAFFTVNVNDNPNPKIKGDLNTCLATTDVYKINVAMNTLDSVKWKVIPFAGSPQNGYQFIKGQKTIETEIGWNASGQYRIKVEGWTKGGCYFADSIATSVISTASAPQMACNSEINVTVGESCMFELKPEMLLQPKPALIPDEQYEIEVTDPVTGIVYTEGLIPTSMLGKKVKISITHECSGQTCWGYATFEDKDIPKLLCGKDTIRCDESIAPGLLNFGALRRVGYPVPVSIPLSAIKSVSGVANTFTVTGFEKCGDATLAYTDRISDNICTGMFGTIIYRDWKMTNFAGLMSTCTDTIYIKRLDIDSINLNGLKNFVGTESFECPRDINSLKPGSLTGNLTINTTGFCFNIQATFTDQVTQLCGKSYSINRTWTVLDWCTAKVRTKTQIIEVQDKIGPQISVNSSKLIINSDQHSCIGDYDMNKDITVTDACSGIKSVKVTIFQNNVLGKVLYTITDRDFSGLRFDKDVTKIFIYVEAVDSCMRSSEASVMRDLEVRDQIKPIPICDDNTTISIGVNGWAIAGYEAFDDGSRDNCGVEDICVVKMPDLDAHTKLDTDKDGWVLYTSFNAAISCPDSYEGLQVTRPNGQIAIHKDALCRGFIKFCCLDAMQDSILVLLRVTDLSGNQNECMVRASIQDNSAVTVNPKKPQSDDKTISCSEDIAKYLLDNGEVTFLSKVCGLPQVPQFRIAVDTNKCGVGTIRRTWSLTDNFGNSANFTQTITIGLSNEVFNPANIPNLWPQDFTGAGCPGSNIHPDNLPQQYKLNLNPANYPCSQLGVEYKDLVFRNVEGLCAKVLRTWTIIDWCKFSNSNPSAGRFEYVQILKLTDSQKPTITSGCTTEVFEIKNNSNCSAFISVVAQAVDCHDPEDLAWTYDLRTNSGQTILTGKTNKINTNLTAGIYSVVWTVTDPCGNTDQCTKRIEVIDAAPPTISCRDISRSIGANGTLTVNAQEFIANATDNCSAQANLTYRYSAVNGQSTLQFTCASLQGQAQRTFNFSVFVVDEFGNFSKCDVVFTLTNQNNVCNNVGNSVVVAGEVYTELNYTVDNAVVEVMEMSSGTQNTQSTPIDGSYAFDQLGMFKSYEVTAKRNDNYLNGVTTLDILLIQRHILGISRLDSPYKLIAADVDGSQHVSATDLVHMRKLILGNSIDFPVKKSWVFIDAKQKFADAQKPFPFTEKLNLNNLESNISDLDFIGVKMGDVNGNVFLESAAISGKRSVDKLEIKVLNQTADRATIAINPTEGSGINGMQFSLGFDERLVKINAISSDLIKLTEENYQIQNGELRMSWQVINPMDYSKDRGQHMLIFSVDLKKKFNKPSEIFALTQTMSSEIYRNNGNDEYESFDLTLIDATEVLSSFEVKQNVPNPFNTDTEIGFFNSERSQIELKVYNLAGQEVYRFAKSFDKGWQSIQVSKHQLNGGGVYIYELSNGTQLIRKKMIAID